MSTPNITEITDGLEFPEGPVWMPDGSVLVAELRGGRVTRVAPDGAKTTVAEPGGSPNGLAIGPDGALYVANSGGWGWQDLGGILIPDAEQPDDYSGGRIERIDLASGDVKVLYTECDGNELVGPNDLVFDAHGGFYFTDHGKHRGRVRTIGAIFYAQADGSSIREVVFPSDSPNGVGLSPDGTRLYAAETYTGRVYAWTLSAARRGRGSGPGDLRAARHAVLRLARRRRRRQRRRRDADHRCAERDLARRRAARPGRCSATRWSPTCASVVRISRRRT